MAAPYSPDPLAYGYDPKFVTAPIVNLPEGARVVRRRVRIDDFPFAFVRIGNTLGRYRIDYCGDALCIESFPEAIIGR